MKGFKGYINFLTGGLVFVAFLVFNLMKVEFATQAFLSVLLNSGLMMVCWILIRNAFAEQGLISGQKDSEVKKTKKEHLITSNEISTYKADFNAWCQNKNEERLKQKRVAILSGSSLVYEDYFNNQGVFNGEEVPLPEVEVNKKANRINRKRYRKDCRLLNKARFAFVAPYEAEEITAKENFSTRKKLFGLSIKQWKNIKLASSVLLSLAISIMLAFTKTSGKLMTADALMILVFEMLVMAGSAFAFYFSASNFICHDWREGLIQKIRIMEEFYRSTIGTIEYENDVQQSDGTIKIGKKIFKKRSDYKPLTEILSEKEKEKKSKGEDIIQTENEKIMEVDEERSPKQGNDFVDIDSRGDILVSSDSLLDSSTDNKPVVLDDN